MSNKKIDKTQIEKQKISHKDMEILTHRLNDYLNIALLKNGNVSPTIPSTFECIENSSPAFKNILQDNLSLEYEIKQEIGKILVAYYKDKEFMRPPYKDYFNDIIKNLTS